MLPQFSCAQSSQHKILFSLNAHVNDVQQHQKHSYRFPRVFGDEFGDEFGDSLNFVSKLVTHLVMISVNHCIW